MYVQEDFALSLALALVSVSALPLSFYVMGKVLMGELSCTRTGLGFTFCSCSSVLFVVYSKVHLKL